MPLEYTSNLLKVVVSRFRRKFVTGEAGASPVLASRSS
jgi:hypothetical protein